MARYFRLMPVLLSLLALFAWGLTLGALYLDRPAGPALMLWLCTGTLCLFHLDDAEAVKRGRATVMAHVLIPVWFLEYPGGLGATLLAFRLLWALLAPSPAATPTAGSVSMTHLLFTVGLGLLFLFTVLAWWYQVLRELRRPEPSCPDPRGPEASPPRN